MNKNTVGYIAIMVMLLVSGFLSANLFLREKIARDKIDIKSFPYKIGDWKGKDLEVTEQEYKILETRNLVLREYTNKSGKKASLFIIYSETNRSVFHPPEVCLIGSGIAIVDKKSEEIKIDRVSFCANKLYTEKNGLKETVLYSYKAGRTYTDNYYFQQAYLALNQIFGRRIPGATVRVSSICRKDSDTDIETLKNFLKETIKALDSITAG